MKKKRICISIIVPILNESQALNSLRDWWRGRSSHENVELIVCVAKAREHDASVKMAQTFARVVSDLEPSRAGQMNAGASVACGEVLLFLHIDSRPPIDFSDRIVETLARSGVAAGVFSHRFSEADMYASLKIISGINRFRYGVTGNYYGDQGLFLTKKLFEQLNGFPEIPILEDLQMVKNLRRAGRVECLQDVMKTSGRRFIHAGPWRTFFYMWRLLWMDFLGMNLKHEAQRYNHDAQGCGQPAEPMEALPNVL